MGAAIHRERMLQSFANDDVDLEAVIAARWHAYAPRLQELARELPPRAVHLSYTATETPALLALRSWNDCTGDYADDVEAEINIAVVAGTPGTGKTLAAVWLLLHRLADQDPVFVSAMALSRLPRFGEEQRERLLAASLLVVDDLGVEAESKRFSSDFDELVDRHYQGHGQLIITTNCTAKDFRQRYGRRVVDRLAERGTWIAASGPSLRGKRT